MRFLSVFLLILVSCVSLCPVHAQTIPLVSTPCVGCTTQAQLTAAAKAYFNTWVGGTPKGYVGTVRQFACDARVPTTTLVVASTTVALSGKFTTCYNLSKSGEYISVFTPIVMGVPKMVSIAPGSVPATMPAIGTTDAAINANFPTVILWIFQHNAGINTQISNLPDAWLAQLSHDYYVATGGNITPLMNQAAMVLSAANLARWRAAFGVTVTNNAVSSYAPASVQLAYSTLTYPMIQHSQAHYAAKGLNVATPAGVAGMPSPLWTASLDEVFLEFYCVGTGTTFSEAAIMMANWASGPVGKTAVFSYGSGTAIYHFAEAMNPDFWYNMIVSLSWGTLDLTPPPLPPNVTTFPLPDQPTTTIVPIPGFYDWYEWVDCFADYGC